MHWRLDNARHCGLLALGLRGVGSLLQQCRHQPAVFRLNRAQVRGRLVGPQHTGAVLLALGDVPRLSSAWPAHSS